MNIRAGTEARNPLFAVYSQGLSQGKLPLSLMLILRAVTFGSIDRNWSVTSCPDYIHVISGHDSE